MMQAMQAQRVLQAVCERCGHVMRGVAAVRATTGTETGCERCGMAVERATPVVVTPAQRRSTVARQLAYGTVGGGAVGGRDGRSV